MHEYFRLYGPTTHPEPWVQSFIGQVFFYFLQVATAAAETAGSNCQQKSETISYVPSATALQTEIPCPKGTMTTYGSRKLFFGSNDPGIITYGKWRLVEDRPNKFGWVTDEVSSQQAEEVLNDADGIHFQRDTRP